uniref:uncharacterized protein isoform X4 n=1 Tax=Pristiophorus japonicus TaxID=55135 RepID=UPI00398EFDA4
MKKKTPEKTLRCSPRNNIKYEACKKRTMSGRDLRMFITNHRTEDAEKLVIRIQNGLGSQKYKPVDYQQLQALAEAKKMACLDTELKIQKILQAAKVNKEHTLIKQHQQVWWQEQPRLVEMRQKVESQLQKLLEDGGTENVFYFEMKEYGVLLRGDQEAFRIATVDPILQLKKDLKQRLIEMQHCPSQQLYQGDGFNSSQILEQRKVAHNKREITRTGRGPANLQPLTSLEERVAALMGVAWIKATTTAQAGPTLKGEELESNPDDAEEDSDDDEPEENIFQSHPPDQEHGGEREGMEMNEAPTVLLTLEEVQVPPIELPAPSVTSGLSVGGTLHGFLPSEAAGPSGVVQRGTPMAPPSKAAGPSCGVRAIPVGRRGRRAQPRSPEVQDLTDVLQMMAMSGESIDLTRSLLVTISGIGHEVAGLSGEVTAISQEMGMMSGTMSEGISQSAETRLVTMKEGMSQVADVLSVSIREGMSEMVQTLSVNMREGMLQVADTLLLNMREGMLQIVETLSGRMRMACWS